MLLKPRSIFSLTLFHCRSAILVSLIMLGSLAGATCVAQENSLSTKVSSIAPESCLSWVQWANPYQADANSSNAVDRMMAEADVNKFCKDLADKLGKLPEALVPEDAPEPIRKAAATMGPQIVDALLRKQGCFFVEPFELNEDQEPKELKIGVALEIGDDVTKTIQAIDELLKTLGAPMEVVDVGGESVMRVALPPSGPVREIGIGKQDGYLIAATSMELLQQVRSRMEAGKVAPWLNELQSKQTYQRISAVGKLDLAMLKKSYSAMIDGEALKVMQALGVDNLKELELSGGFDETDFVQRYAMKFDGQPSGIFNAFGDEGLTEANIAHFPEDSFLALALSIDGKKAMKQFQDTLVQLDPNQANELASGLIQFQSQTGIDLREVIEGLGPSFSIHNGFGDGIISGAMLKATIKDPASFEKAVSDAVRLAENMQEEFTVGIDSSTLNGKSVKTMHFGGVPVPVEPSWFFEDDQMTLSLFPSVLSSVTNSDSVPALVKSKSFAPYLPLFQGDSAESKIIGFSYSESKLSYEMLYGYACLLKAMGKNVLSGPYNPRLGMGISESQFENLQELFSDLQLPSCRSIVKHLTPQVAVLSMEKDAIVLESHSSVNSSNVMMLAPGIAVGMLLPAVQAVRSAARRTQSANNLKQMALAAHNYESAFMHFPSGDGPVNKGGPAVSWRVKILPFIEQNNLYEMYNVDEPWDSENNRKILEMMPEVFQNPASMAQPGYTVYRGIGGKNGAMGVDGQGNSRDTRIGNIVDGTSNTIMLVEAPDRAAVPWTKPDGGVDPTKVRPEHMIGNYPGGFNAAFCDGSVHFIPTSILPETLKNLMEMNDGNIIRDF